MHAQAVAARAASAARNAFYTDNVGLLHTFAKKGFGRLAEAGVSVTYEDVYQQMSESLVRCIATFDESKGWKFAAYFGQSCWNNFNRWAERMIEERMRLGLVSTEALAGDGLEEDDGGDAYEFIAHDEEDDDTPESLLERRQSRLKNIAMLSPNAKRAVSLLLHQTPEFMEFFDSTCARMALPPKEVTLRMIFRFLNLKKSECDRVRAELERVYGVKL
ncbi:hypothetical protein [Burkholderia vietnamiensis]|uniref:hypothetical protein n=1 Tax=Burkholderia vietnamiensis TaxID=60552 RepID=UPI001CB2EA05|nr:hypothetical protein [Burkholderia vietnamiensis]CAG9229077.1 putative Sigma70_r2 domain-containing protein [Burkholderia vietnamiensis]HDR9086322.1 hypothetical protein [Burkholderia vietnamiensis]